MALTIASGVDGSVTFVTGHVAKFDSWRLLTGQRLNNITGYDSGGFEENLGGLKYGEFEASGFFKYGASTTAPGAASVSKTGGTATFQVATGCTLAATCIVGTVESTSNVNNEARVRYTGKTAGTITETWATS